MNETTINDYIPMLNAKGYQAYSFDVSAIKGRNATFNVREFVNGKEVEDSPRLLFPYYFEARGDKLTILQPFAISIGRTPFALVGV